MEEENLQSDLLHPVAASAVRRSHWTIHRVLGTFVFAGVLTLVCWFSWRVFSVYQEIRNGTINPALAYTTTDFTRAASAFATKVSTGTNSPSLIGTKSPTLGAKDAKVTVVEFADFGCPYSQEVAPIVRAIAKQYPKDVRVVFRNYPLEDLHPGATLAAQAGYCAQAQGKFWEYYDAVLGSKETLGVEMLTSIADQIGMNTKQLGICLDSEAYADAVVKDSADGASLGVTGTPTFFFNGQKVEGSIPFTIFNQIIDAIRKT